MPTLVVVDYREEHGDVVRWLNELGLQVKVERLEVGDYVVSDRVVVERKTVMDLASSIVDRRLFEQASAMSKAFPIPVLVVEGDLNELYRRRMFTPSQIQGAMAYLLELGIRIAPSTGPYETALLIQSLAKREQSYHRREVKYSPPKMKRAKGGKSLKEAQINLVASIPGIGYELAERILRFFGSPRRFFKASPYELRKIPGMGESRVNRIIELLDTKFEGIEL
ncbi:MAG: hypothetical protein DRJ97_01035 [Thermoprotei archaeon]|nr:MAG: hypothetical protein DRJ97_01035 [Thermoprotei archaeon]